jgi:hypothetical protein
MYTIVRDEKTVVPVITWRGNNFPFFDQTLYLLNEPLLTVYCMPLCQYYIIFTFLLHLANRTSDYTKRSNFVLVLKVMRYRYFMFLTTDEAILDRPKQKTNYQKK